MLALQIVTSILNAVLLVGLSIRLVHIFQLGGYRVSKFCGWIIGRQNAYAMMLFVLGILGLGSTWLVYNFSDSGWAYFGLLFYIVLAITAITISLKRKNKVPLRLTPRVYRLLAAIFLIAIAPSFEILFRTSPQFLPLIAIALPVIVVLAALVVCPIESIVKQRYINRAKRKLFSKDYENLIRIGIAGSYGKTTCKNILAKMLEQKYSVLPSPASFNTPMGFTKTVLEKLEPTHQVFIMEMGERFKGDIREMCELFKPHHGIITSIGTAHLETFKTPDAIKAEIYELENWVKKSPDGFAVTPFTKGEFVNMQTRLLGKHNQENIALCAAMARKLGLTEDHIKTAVAALEPVPHRLQLIESENGVKILDDSYNSNPDGVTAALNVLKDLKQKNAAIVMTPGMVELGKTQYDENKKFGAQMAGIADRVIIIGEVNKLAIQSGLLENGFDKNNIHLAPTVEHAKTLFPTLLTPGDVLLIENDLPDNFN